MFDYAEGVTKGYSGCFQSINLMKQCLHSIVTGDHVITHLVNKKGIPCTYNVTCLYRDVQYVDAGSAF